MDRYSLLHFLTAWGDVLFHSLGRLTRVSYWTVQFGSHLGFLTGLACRPADLFIALFGWWLLSRGTPILAGGIGVARFLRWVFVPESACEGFFVKKQPM